MVFCCLQVAQRNAPFGAMLLDLFKRPLQCILTSCYHHVWTLNHEPLHWAEKTWERVGPFKTLDMIMIHFCCKLSLLWDLCVLRLKFFRFKLIKHQVLCAQKTIERTKGWYIHAGGCLTLQKTWSSPALSWTTTLMVARECSNSLRLMIVYRSPFLLTTIGLGCDSVPPSSSSHPMAENILT